jgi:hypothetical protein
MINIHSVEYYFLWQFNHYSGSLDAGLHVVCFLAEAKNIPSIQNIIPALEPIWPFIQYMFWILPQHWNSWSMRLVTHLYFLLRLQIAAVVTVLPLYVFMVYTGTSLPFTIVLKEWLQYLCVSNSVPQKVRAVWSHGTLCHPTLLCGVKTQSVVLWWSVLDMEAWKPLFILFFLLCIAHLLSLSLTFSSALVLWPLFGLLICTLPRCVS